MSITHDLLIVASSNPDNLTYRYRFGIFVDERIHPPLKPGDVFILDQCPPEDIEVGDIILVKLYGANRSEGYTREVVRIITERNGETGLWFVATPLIMYDWAEDDNTSKMLDRAEDEIMSISAERVIGKIAGRIPALGQILGGNPVVRFLTYLICWGFAIILILSFVRRRRKSL